MARYTRQTETDNVDIAQPVQAEPRARGNVPGRGGDDGFSSSVKDRTASQQSPVRRRKFRSIGRTDTINIASQLAVMADTGVPLSEALEGLKRQSDKPQVKEALQSVLDEVTGGSDLSAAVARSPYRFPVILPCLLRASEASGTMGLMLDRAAIYLKDEQDTVKRVRGAMTYPTVMLGLALVTTILMFTFLLPRFEAIYRGHEAMLPAPTRVAFAINNVLCTHWLLIIIVTVVLLVSMVAYFCTSRGRITIDWLKLHCPLISRIFRKFYLARSVRTIGTLIQSGLTIPDAVRLSRDVTGNSYYTALWSRVDRTLQAGQPLADPLFVSPLVPNIIAQMITTGEKTGHLGDVMERTAMFCESDLKHTIRAVTALLEPIMIMIMGAIMGSMAMAVLLPVFKISKLLTSGS